MSLSNIENAAVAPLRSGLHFEVVLLIRPLHLIMFLILKDNKDYYYVHDVLAQCPNAKFDLGRGVLSFYFGFEICVFPITDFAWATHFTFCAITAI